MLQILVIRVLTVLLIIYSVHYVLFLIKQWKQKKDTQIQAYKRESTEYDESEWEKIKKDLEK